MKIFVVFLATAVALASGLISDEERDVHFEKFKSDFSRSYASPAEEQLRKAIFHSNLEFIFQHNMDYAMYNRYTFTVEINNFTDLTNDEFRQLLNLAVPKTRSANIYRNSTLKGLPVAVDWVQKGVVTPPINQGPAGSSASIPVVSAIESQQALNNGNNLIPLSNQQLIDCCGRNSGTEELAYYCIILQGGLDTDASYPYTGMAGTCRFKKNSIGAQINGWENVAQDEASLKNAIANVGPMAAAIDASLQSFQFYSSGVYYDPKCAQIVDHGVTVVGYGVDADGSDFWKVKNSWGTGWGEGGYVRMARNRGDLCGIATQASFPVMIQGSAK